MTRSALRRTIDWCQAPDPHVYLVGIRRCASSARSGFCRSRVKLIENKTGGCEYIPTDLRHLELFRRLSARARILQLSGRLGADAAAAAADRCARLRHHPGRYADAGCDQAEPANAKVVCVVHDLLPLTDLRLSDVATRLFLSRLFTSLQSGRRTGIRLQLQPEPLPGPAAAVHSPAGAGGLSAHALRCA